MVGPVLADSFRAFRGLKCVRGLGLVNTVIGEFYCTSKVRLQRMFVCPKAKP